MPSTPSDRLRVELQARGENVNSWGDTRLNEALKRLEESIAGVLTLTVTGDVVLSSQNFIADQSRMGTLVLIGTPSANFRVTIPGVEKTYNVINLTPRIANFGVADMATVPVRAGLSNLVVCDGSVTRVVDLTLDQIRSAAAAVNFGGQRITNVAAATLDTDGINRGQAISLTSPQVTRAQEWANKTGAVVDAGEYSAKEYAIGTTVPAGSSREWSVTTGGLVDATEYAAKEYAIGTTVPAGSARRWAIGSIGDGSAKDWATLLTSIVAASEYSAKEYAVGATAPLGSAKRWATATGVVADGLLGARGYANNSASSAQSASDQAGAASTSATNSANSATASQNALADFNNRYVVAAQFPTTGNFAGRLAFATSGNQFGVFDSGTGAYQTITSPSQATETTSGIVRLATASEALDGTNTQAVLTPARVRSAAGVRYRARTSNTQLTVSDNNALIDATGTFTQTFATPSALGANWSCSYKNAGTGNITIPASDGVTNWIMYPGEMRLFQSDGTTLRSEVIHPFYVVFISSGTFIKPPGYTLFEGLLWAGGGGGGTRNTGGGGHGGGGNCTPICELATTLASSVTVSIGAGGSGAVNSTAASAGGNSAFGAASSFGGGGGGNGSAGGGQGQPGGGGGLFSAGGNATATAAGAQGLPVNTSHGGASQAVYGGGVRSYFGGAQGGGGTSVLGGNGGGVTSASPGSAPGGGGTGNLQTDGAAGGAGARGELRLWGVA